MLRRLKHLSNVDIRPKWQGTNEVLFSSFGLIAAFFLGFGLRVYHLEFQSLWLDELHTLIEADPNLTWAMLFNALECCDQQPPLFFILERLLFSLFGHTAFVARMLSVVAGSLSVIGMFYLGRTLINREVGVTAALLLAVNYFGIWYAQDARSYSLLLLFTIISYWRFLRLNHATGLRSSLAYSFACILLVYTHYFGMMVVFSQVLLGIILLFKKRKEDAVAFARYFILAGFICLLFYLPWVPYLLQIAEITTFWIEPVSADFFVDYFHEFFGNTMLLQPLLWALLGLLLLNLTYSTRQSSYAKSEIRWLFVILFVWYFGALLVPYLRSILLVPMLVSRYGIIVLPAAILAIGVAINLIPWTILRLGVLAVFLFLSLYDLFHEKRYYETAQKTQFREVMAFMKNHESYPILSEKVGWHLQYYNQHLELNAPIQSGKRDSLVKTAMVDSTMRGFWLVGAHGEEPPNDSLRRSIEKYYSLESEGKFFDAWALLFKRSPTSLRMFRSDAFPDVIPFDSEGGPVVPIWAGKIHSTPIQMNSGSFQVALWSRGTPLNNEQAKVRVYWNGAALGQYTETQSFSKKSFRVNITDDTMGIFSFELLNDAMDSSKNEDRNVFIDHIQLLELPSPNNEE